MDSSQVFAFLVLSKIFPEKKKEKSQFEAWKKYGGVLVALVGERGVRVP